MSRPHQPQPTNPNSLKIRLAYRFLYNLKTLPTKPSNFHQTTQIHRRSRRVKLAAYASMAYVAGSRRAWSRAILCKIRNQYKKKIHHRKTTRLRHDRNYSNPNYYVDLFGNSGQEVKLRRLVPGSETMDACGLLDETADYIKCLETQVEVMKTLVDLYSTI